MNALAIGALVNGIVSILSGLLVFSRNVKGSVNKSYFFMTASIAIWSFGYFIWQISLDKPSALFWLRFLSAGAVLIPISYFYWVLTILDISGDKTKEKILRIGCIISAFFLILSFTTLMVRDVAPKLSFKFWGVPGVLYPFFLVMFFGFILYATFLMVVSLKRLTGFRRNQIKYAILAAVVGFGGGATNYPLWYGIPIYPLGNFLVFLYPMILTYAILRHRLMDIHIVIKKSLIYSLSAGLLTGFFIVFVLSITKLISTFAHIDSFKVSIIAAIIIALLFNPLRNRIQTLVDKVFYKKTYDYYGTIQKVSHDLVSMFDFRKIYTFVGDIIFSTLGLKNIYLLSAATGGNYTVVYSRLFEAEKREEKGDKETSEIRTELKIDKNSEIVKLLRTSDDILIKDKLPAIKEILGQETIDNITATLKPFNGEVIVPIFVDNKLELLLILGEKLSEDIFSNEDVKLLDTVSHQTAIAIKNSQLYVEKFRTERLASIGMMSATFAHEIRNPLTSIKTFAQLIPEKYADIEFRETFSKIVIDEIGRIDGLIKDLLSVSSKEAVPGINELDITVLIDETLEHIKGKLELERIKINVEKIYKNVKINTLGDSKKLKQAFINVISNGCQAMEENGILTVDIVPNGQNVDVKITDTGKGISLQDIARIFEPFFTTKAMGVGLGLAISKKIIEDHGGSMKVESKLSKGTTFTISLPVQNN